MTDYSVADEIAAELLSVTPEIAGAAHADAYSIVRNVETSDLEGGATTVPATVETGRCRLIVSQRMGGERGSGGILITPISLYTAELSTEDANGNLVPSIVTENDTLGMSGRSFNVTDTKRGGAFTLFTVVELEER